MPSRSQADFLGMFREFVMLDKRRVDAGLSPFEFQRWSDLSQRLGQSFEQRGVDKTAKQDATRMCLEFQTPEEFAAARLDGLVRGDGVWVDTPFTAPIGCSFVARIQIASTGEALDLPCAVVSTNLVNDHSNASPGMGIRFAGLSAAQHRRLGELRGVPAKDPSVADGSDGKPAA